MNGEDKVPCPACGRETAAPPSSAVRCGGCGAHYWALRVSPAGPGTPFALEIGPPSPAERIWTVAAPLLLLAAFVSILVAEVAGLVALGRWALG